MKRRRLFTAALACVAPRAFAQPAQSAKAPPLTWLDPGRIAAAPLLAAPMIDLDGKPAKLVQRPGRPMIVNFWARWCAPCKVEIPELVALRARVSGIDIVGVNVEVDPAPVRDFARAYEIDYPVLLVRDNGLDLMRTLGNPGAGLPFTLVLDRQGALVALRLGLLTREHLDAIVQRVIG